MKGIIQMALSCGKDVRDMVNDLVWAYRTTENGGTGELICCINVLMESSAHSSCRQFHLKNALGIQWEAVIGERRGARRQCETSYRVCLYIGF
ncbi:hypothetical protein NDU88_002198 [Pleurodeles waltl]|uniref:Uncharacterized protein n=1 Tax=Pleurodeles waltl TaxID=8319 RepID=A0AAV7T1A1_PLEWA|nr:hypothetical protein NDU88_002198 [Pleurodeles waltl]